MKQFDLSRLVATILCIAGATVALLTSPSPGKFSPSRIAEAAPLPRGPHPQSAPQAGDEPAVPAVEPGSPTEVAPTLDFLPFGETLIYRGRVRKAGLSFEAGRATLRAKFDRKGQPVLEARAFGEKFGYELNTRITSTLDAKNLRPLLHYTAERGTERRTKKIEFVESGADFIRLKHCKTEGCTDESHFVKQAKMHGPIPWGTEHVHCTDRDCKHREHYSWRTRTEHRYEDDYVDLLSAIYIARQIEFDPAAEPIVIPIVSDTRRWKVRVQAKKQKSITVTAGSFDAVQLVLEPLVADDGKEKEKFRGLFGLNGTIRIWVDREFRRPILIEGSLPFAFLELHAQIELEKIELDEGVRAIALERFADRLLGGPEPASAKTEEEKAVAPPKGSTSAPISPKSR